MQYPGFSLLITLRTHKWSPNSVQDFILLFKFQTGVQWSNLLINTHLLHEHSTHESQSPQDYYHGNAYHCTANLLWWTRIAVVSNTTSVLKIERPLSLRRRTRWSVFCCNITCLSLGAASLVEDSFLFFTRRTRQYTFDATRWSWWTFQFAHYNFELHSFQGASLVQTCHSRQLTKNKIEKG